MKLIKYIALVGMFAIIACSEPIEIEPLTYSKIFTGDVKRAWSIRSIQYLQKGKATQNLGVGDCVLDDLYIFYNNPERTIQVLEGTTVCTAGDPDLIAEASWSFINATATLNMPMPLLTAAPYPPIPFILKEVDDTKMVVDIYFEDGSAYRFNFKVASVE